jgi:hypothetical protein
MFNMKMILNNPLYNSYIHSELMTTIHLNNMFYMNNLNISLL